jgi:HSP20 family protein
MASVSRYDPFGEMVDDFLKGFFVKPLAYEQSAEPVRRMRIDVSEHNGEYRVLAELPGAKKEDINVQIDGDQVSITAEVRGERDAREGERVLHSERYFGKIARAFRLGEELDETKAVAKYNDGILELTLPKKATTASRQISIQ